MACEAQPVGRSGAGHCFCSSTAKAVVTDHLHITFALLMEAAMEVAARAARAHGRAGLLSPELAMPILASPHHSGRLTRKCPIGDNAG